MSLQEYIKNINEMLEEAKIQCFENPKNKSASA